MKKIGEILLENGIITKEQLYLALKIQEREKIIQVGMILILLNYITPQQLLNALDLQKRLIKTDYPSTRSSHSLCLKQNHEVEKLFA